jgi:hypothetical protein
MSLGIDYLTQRGITQGTATVNGLEFDFSPLEQSRIVSRLNNGCVPLWTLAQELIWFPIHLNGAQSIYSWITRPLPTLASGPKFVTPKGGTAPPFVPIGVAGLARSLPLIITEGPVKSLASAQAGVATIGLNGIWCASSQTPDNKLVLRKSISLSTPMPASTRMSDELQSGFFFSFMKSAPKFTSLPVGTCPKVKGSMITWSMRH